MHNSRFLLKPIYTFILCFGLCFANEIGAQVSEGGTPPSFNYASTLRSESPVEQIPVNFCVEDLKTVDAWQVSQGAPLAIARQIDVDFTTDNAGVWSTLPGGEKIWQLHLRAKEAEALMLYYKTFYIPEGGKLFIYNRDKTQVLGAYTARNNPQTTSAFATELIAGDELILEYVAAPSGEAPRIEIEQVGYGYNHLDDFASLNASTLRSSGNCMVNINCEEGEEWQEEKKGICKMIMKNGNATYLCSASLVNNTAMDKTPYILSAYHCLLGDNDRKASTEDMNQWIFYFNYEKTRCDNRSPAYKPQTLTGCQLIAASPIHKGSDGMLLLLNETIPDNYDVYYNGWDWNHTAPSSGVCIHHPQGDYKKISTYGNKVVENATWLDENDNLGATHAHWEIHFDATTNGYSIIEGGSSGSPLFNQNKRIVGTLSGSSPDLSCDYPDQFALYGKLSYHWNRYSNDASGRMDVWLDPLNSGVKTISGLGSNDEVPSTGYKAPTDVTATTLPTGDVSICWKAPVYISKPDASGLSDTESFPEITQYNIYRNDSKIAVLPATKRQYTDEQATATRSLYQVTAVYGTNESPKVTADWQSYVANERITSNPISITPTLFNEQIHLMNHQQVKRLEIYSINGRLIRSVASPEATLYTGDLPQGHYIFRLYTDQERLTIQGIKR